MNPRFMVENPDPLVSCSRSVAAEAAASLFESKKERAA